ncbi:unnamed protein product [Hermetia illucens]|uniref:C2H2-type domain-containing protein n=1 Tax=Hermetia illucens TaxID=343691 RepID=A0A7R8V6V9_HERIL|nr:zinc finger protein 32-like [Hermetia illucens]CAD7093102.1 unnamed protein product [Hermetia illucens]
MEKTPNGKDSDIQMFTSISCMLCDLTVTKEEILKHITTHKNESPFQCPDCSDLFGDLEAFRDHVDLPGNLPSNDCTTVSQTTAERCLENIMEYPHERRKSVAIDPPISFKGLQKTTNSIDDRRVGPKLHSEIKPEIKIGKEQIVKIKNLNGGFDETKTSLQKTVDSAAALEHNFDMTKCDSPTNQNASRNTFNCLTCNKSFSKKSNLQIHKRIHSGVQDYQCNYCGRTFSYAGNLKVHLRKHTGDRPYQCKVCKKTFYNASNRSHHERKHAGEKVRCETCGKYVSDLSSYIKHRRIHTGQKSYECEICKKSFRQMEHLRKHIRGHTGEKPFCCDICKKCFGRKDVLAIHKRRHSTKNSKNSSKDSIN